MNITKNFQKWYKDFTCGHCNKKSGYEIRYAEAEFFAEELDIANGLGFAIVQCHACEELNMIVLCIKGDHYHESIKNEFELQNVLNADPQIIKNDWFDDGSGLVDVVFMLNQGQYPYGLDLSEKIPKQIRGDLYEVFNCLAVGASNASVTMSRRVVQQIALHFGIAPKTYLKHALDELKEQRHIDDRLYDALIEVKNWGDGGAHPGKFDPVLLDEAKQVAELVLILTKSIFPTDGGVESLVNELKRIRGQKSL